MKVYLRRVVRLISLKWTWALRFGRTAGRGGESENICKFVMSGWWRMSFSAIVDVYTGPTEQSNRQINRWAREKSPSRVH